MHSVTARAIPANASLRTTRIFDGLFRGLLCAQCNPILGKLENAWVRLGMHKQESVTFVEFVALVASYLQFPPATTALGYAHYGYPGKVNTKRHRLMLKRQNRLKMRQESKEKRMPQNRLSITQRGMR